MLQPLTVHFWFFCLKWTSIYIRICDCAYHYYDSIILIASVVYLLSFSRATRMRVHSWALVRSPNQDEANYINCIRRRFQVHNSSTCSSYDFMEHLLSIKDTKPLISGITIDSLEFNGRKCSVNQLSLSLIRHSGICLHCHGVFMKIRCSFWICWPSRCVTMKIRLDNFSSGMELDS